MTVRSMGLAAALLLSGADAALAQGVFDMGQLTGSLSQDHNTQRERARARRQHATRTPDSAHARAARTCANVPAVRRRLGANDWRVARLIALCRRAGHRVGR